MPLLTMVLGGLTFSRKKMGEAGKEKKDTLPALLLIIISLLIDAAIGYFFGLGRSYASLGVIGFPAAIISLLDGAIGIFVYAAILALVMRLFKVKPTVGGILRVWSAATIWSIIGALVGLVLPPALSMGTILFWLLFNIALMIGLVGYTEAKYWQVFLSIVIGFALIFVITMGFGIVVAIVI